METPKVSPYLYQGMTVAICAVCKKALPASMQERDGKMYLSKSCPEHGRQRTIIASDAAWYRQALEQRSPTVMLRQYQTKTVHGCPHDCGVCPEHEQNNALPVIEVTDLCNMECPVCYADNRGGYHMSSEEMEACLDTLERSGTQVDAIVLVGGEPTAHPRLPELIEQCYRRPFVSRVVVATNGILLGKRRRLAERLAEVGAYIMLQLDSLDPAKNKLMRGQDMIENREACLAVLRELKLDTTLMMVVIKGLNDDEIGALTRMALESDFLTGIDIATMIYTGSGGSQMKFHPLDRITGTDIVNGIVAQAGGFAKSDFLPMLHPHPQCGAVSYVLMLDDGSWVPLVRLADREEYRRAMLGHYIVVPDERHEAFLAHMIDHVWTHEDEIAKADVVLRTLRRAADEIYPADRTLTHRERMRHIERRIKNVYLHNYMDEHSLDAGALRKCACMQVLPDGRMIPDCSYRTIHRASDPRFKAPGSGLSHGNDGLRHQLVRLRP